MTSDMRVSRKTQIVLGTGVILVAVGGFAVWSSLASLVQHAAGRHQRSVTQSLAEWGRDYANITNDTSAIKAVEMLGYIKHYYVPGPGYRGPQEIESALEVQRQNSVNQIAAGLERYTGLSFGTNVQRWMEWSLGHH